VLLDLGADVNRVADTPGREGTVTPLRLALDNHLKTYGSFEIVKILVENGADVNQLDFTGQPPIFEAIDVGDFEAAAFLIEHGADLTVVDKRERGNVLLKLAEVWSDEWAKEEVPLVERQQKLSRANGVLYTEHQHNGRVGQHGLPKFILLLFRFGAKWHEAALLTACARLQSRLVAALVAAAPPDELAPALHRILDAVMRQLPHNSIRHPYSWSVDMSDVCSCIRSLLFVGVDVATPDDDFPGIGVRPINKAFSIQQHLEAVPISGSGAPDAVWRLLDERICRDKPPDTPCGGNGAGQKCRVCMNGVGDSVLGCGHMQCGRCNARFAERHGMPGFCIVCLLDS